MPQLRRAGLGLQVCLLPLAGCLSTTGNRSILLPAGFLHVWVPLSSAICRRGVLSPESPSMEVLGVPFELRLSFSLFSPGSV
jgi:hypothetical protein